MSGEVFINGHDMGDVELIRTEDVILVSDGPCSKCEYSEKKFEQVKQELERLSVDMQRLRNKL